MVVISIRARPERGGLRRRHAGVEAIDEILREPLLFAKDGAAGGLGRVCREHRLDAHRRNQAQRFGKRQALALQPRNAVGDPARLHLGGIAQVLAAAAHSMRLLGGVDRQKPDREGARQIRGRGRGPALHAPLQVAGTPVHGLAPPDRREPVAFHEVEELVAALVAKRLADQEPERMHVLAQIQVLDGELNALTIHGDLRAAVRSPLL
jgi:hypothetical protein